MRRGKKILNGLELAVYIKERQLKQVRALRQSWRVVPKLAIVRTSDNPVIDTYVRLKQSYGHDIVVEVEEYRLSDTELIGEIEKHFPNYTIENPNQEHHSAGYTRWKKETGNGFVPDGTRNSPCRVR